MNFSTLSSDHGRLDLEWLSYVAPDKAKELLLSIRELGQKSVECVGLLSLNQLAFPKQLNQQKDAAKLKETANHAALIIKSRVYLSKALFMYYLQFSYFQYVVIEELLALLSAINIKLSDQCSVLLSWVYIQSKSYVDLALTR
ncbi:uncharacterized protein LOC121972957 [Zingiber officinale]|uniref:uncharacterized protein LOC121972957 n=1 Tax=Zingiber officinale TaxID=94328 RepID=UPI001C4A7C89|nr:uncharacterized protein LOC121972957 [Zingiber officinale]